MNGVGTFRFYWQHEYLGKGYHNRFQREFAVLPLTFGWEAIKNRIGATRVVYCGYGLVSRYECGSKDPYPHSISIVI